MLLSTEWEFLDRSTKATMARIRAGNDLTEAMIARSQEALAKSRALLRTEAPKLWRREPQRAGTTSLCDSNPERASAFSRNV